MKSSLLLVTALAGLNAIAAPTTPPAVDYNSIDYPVLHEYPAPEGGWESVDYPFQKDKKQSVLPPLLHPSHPQLKPANRFSSLRPNIT